MYKAGNAQLKPIQRRLVAQVGFKLGKRGMFCQTSRQVLRIATFQSASEAIELICVCRQASDDVCQSRFERHDRLRFAYPHSSDQPGASEVGKALLAEILLPRSPARMALRKGRAEVKRHAGDHRGNGEPSALVEWCGANVALTTLSRPQLGAGL
jgi:hypothetical protein